MRLGIVNELKYLTAIRFRCWAGGSFKGRFDDDPVAQLLSFGGFGHVPWVAASSSPAVSFTRRPSTLSVATAQSGRFPAQSFVQRQFHWPPLADSCRARIRSAGQPVESPGLSVLVRHLWPAWWRQHQWSLLWPGPVGRQHRRKYENPRKWIPGSFVHLQVIDERAGKCPAQTTAAVAVHLIRQQQQQQRLWSLPSAELCVTLRESATSTRLPLARRFLVFVVFNFVGEDSFFRTGAITQNHQRSQWCAKCSATLFHGHTAGRVVFKTQISLDFKIFWHYAGPVSIP